MEVPELLFNLIGPQPDPFCKLRVGLGGVVLNRLGDSGVVDVEEHYEIFLAFLYQVLQLFVEGADESIVCLEGGVVTRRQG